ncbi:hypothetical protein LR48_Vigan07g167400 [Vigna angularis]|uniref:Uncharacterized protein n=1 Tax=Phaseolus angularis TaxID=3914 RepID=A0A0L9UYQ9_PHAAN|nr:hypothetical protein LR48_Vigan07g167400 [Vigna angularis]
MSTVGPASNFNIQQSGGVHTEMTPRCPAWMKECTGSSIQESSRVQQEGPPGVEGGSIKLASIRNIPRPSIFEGGAAHNSRSSTAADSTILASFITHPAGILA